MDLVQILPGCCWSNALEMMGDTPWKDSSYAASRRNCMCILLLQQVSYWFTQIHGWMIVLSMGHPVFNIGMCWTKVKMTCWWIIGINLQVLHAKCTDATLKKSWFTGSVGLHSPFLKKATVVSRRPRESAQQTFIWHCLKRWFIGCSGCPLFQKLPFVIGSLWASNKARKVRMFRRKESKPTAMKYKHESEIQSNHSFRLKKELVNLGWKFQPDTLELIVLEPLHLLCHASIPAREYGAVWPATATTANLHPFSDWTTCSDATSRWLGG